MFWIWQRTVAGFSQFMINVPQLLSSELLKVSPWQQTANKNSGDIDEWPSQKLLYQKFNSRKSYYFQKILHLSENLFPFLWAFCNKKKKKLSWCTEINLTKIRIWVLSELMFWSHYSILQFLLSSRCYQHLFT